MQIEKLRERFDLTVTIETLVADDDHSYCQEAVAALEKHNTHFRCDAAYNLKDAIDKLGQRSYDLLAADWFFNDRGNGWLMFDPAKRGNRWASIVVVSGHATAEQAAFERGASAVILKSGRRLNGDFTEVMDRSCMLSLRNKLNQLAHERPCRDAFLYATSPRPGPHLDVRREYVVEVVETVLKLQSVENDTRFVERLRLNTMLDLLTTPSGAFILCYIRDFGPIEMSTLLEEVKLPNTSIEEVLTSFVLASLVEIVDSGIQITCEGVNYLRAFELEWDEKQESDSRDC